ncbi:hypothetical protein [Pandoraea bronchicola]|uniref:Uncharacterized protein n=1 Tax=Pandoraea bronchicola TaxID=2508287 RepID=A0A5E5BQJ2_9BURK|nr:hypothetical protein [Pandoraea bronchicola]VVE87577.1 hypothetical protein PBR20603_01513 [Pandoraea bronchicola]
MLSQEQLLEAIGTLRRVGAELHFNCPHPSGWNTMIVSDEDLVAYALGQLHLPSKLTGLTPTEFASWMESGGYVQCCATTRHGRRCRKFVTHNRFDAPLAWKALADTHPYCATHGG